MGRGTLLEVQHGSGDPPSCSWMVRGTVKEVWDWSRDPLKGLGRDGEVLQKIQNRWGVPSEGRGWVRGPSWRSSMG